LIGYIVRRLGIAVIVVVGVSILTFVLLHSIYPSPAITVLGPHATTAAINAWNKDNGFASPWFVQYLHYGGNLLHGNFGYSYRLNQPVTSLFAARRRPG
jgi:peptide/nickel transport system permease protein